jgi:hypothetical protein
MSVPASYERAQSSSASLQTSSTSTECMSCRSGVGWQSGHLGDDTLSLRSSAVVCEKGVFVAMRGACAGRCSACCLLMERAHLQIQSLPAVLRSLSSRATAGSRQPSVDCHWVGMVEERLRLHRALVLNNEPCFVRASSSKVANFSTEAVLANNVAMEVVSRFLWIPCQRPFYTSPSENIKRRAKLITWGGRIIRRSPSDPIFGCTSHFYSCTSHFTFKFLAAAPATLLSKFC